MSGSWTSNSNIIISIDGLSIGSHNFTIVVQDLFGNSVSDTVIVDVVSPLLTSEATSETDTTVPVGGFSIFVVLLLITGLSLFKKRRRS